jgi:hypothetical protein
MATDDVTPSALPQTTPAENVGSALAGALAIADAEKYIGKPWKLGAWGPDSFDCVGLVHRVFDDIGHSSLVGGSSTVSGVAATFRARGAEDTAGDMMPADLVVYGPYEHLAINIDGSNVISALGGFPPDTTKPGVQITGITAILDETGAPMPIKSVLHTGLSSSGVTTSSADLSPSGVVGAAEGAVAGPVVNAATGVATALAAVPSQVAQGVLAVLMAWIPEFAANAGVMLLIAVLFVMGIRRVLDAGGGQP